MKKSIKYFITGLLISCVSFILSFMVALFECLSFENSITHALFTISCYGVCLGVFYMIITLFYCLFKDLKQTYYEK